MQTHEDGRKESGNHMLVRKWRIWNTCALLGGMYNGIAPVANVITVTKNISQQFLAWVYIPKT
jgi:hypothetical protein